MSDDLHQKPATSVEYRDMKAITDPRQQKQFSTNQGVRFYVDQETTALEGAIMHTVTECLATQAESMRQMGEAAEFAARQIADLQERMKVLELRWYERLMQDFEWDIFTIRIWLFKKFHIGSDPEAVVTKWEQENAEAIQDMRQVIADMQPPGETQEEMVDRIGDDEGEAPEEKTEEPVEAETKE